MCITVKKILGSDMPKSQKCRAIYQKGVYVHGYNNSDIRPRSVQARKLRAWFRTETIPVDPWWGTDNGSDYLCHIMSQWISQGCPVIDISEFANTLLKAYRDDKTGKTRVAPVYVTQ